MSALEWHVSGVGSISCLITANLHKNNITCSQISKPNRAKICQTLVCNDQQTLLPKPKWLDEIDTISNIVIATKSFGVLPFFKQIESKLTATANIVLCHNGLGTIEQISPLLQPMQKLYFCTTNNGVYKKENHAFHVGFGPSYYSEVTTNNSEHHGLTQHDFDMLLTPCYAEPDLQPLLWKKLLINCAINPLTAIHKVTNGQLALPEYKATINNIIQEGLIVASRMGVTLPKNMIDIVYDVIESTQSNYSSMYQDINNHKKTEIDFINGYLINQAKQVSVDTPTNQYLTEKIKQLTA